jgi:hypothetical protein
LGSADFGGLLTCRYNFRVAFGHLHTAYVNFFFENKTAFDNNDFFDYGQYCRIAFLPDGRYGGNGPSDRDTLDLYPGV